MSEKTEEPTPRKLRKAREQGDSPLSGPVVQAVGFIAALSLAPAALSALAAQSGEMLRNAIFGGELPSAPALAAELVMLAAPVIAGAAAAAGVAAVAQTGGVVAFQRLAPDANRVNPFTTLKSLFSAQRMIGVVRALCAATLVLAYAAHQLRTNMKELAGSAGNLARAVPAALHLTSHVAWFAAFVGLALALVDLLVAQRAFRKRQRMTKDEVKREYRETEGDPEIKAARRRAHQEVLAGAAIANVKNATVVIVNPTHIAVALHYSDEGEDAAPRVLAQGQGELARRMIEAAHAYNVPVVRDVPVARALADLEIGQEIPEALYEAVAEILREVWSHERERAEP